MAAWIVPIGLATGLLWVGAFRLTWRLYGEAGSIPIIPALTVILFECLLTGPFLILGIARTADRWGGPPRPPWRAGTPAPHSIGAAPDPWSPLSPVGMLVLLLVVLSQWVLIVSIPDRAGWWPSDADWRHYFNIFYPRPIFRPLLLAPLWGRWGILLAATVGKTAPGADRQTVALGRAMRPGRLLRQAILPLILTAVFFSREHNRGLGVIIGMLVFSVIFIAAVVMARQGGGQTRQTMFAAGQVGQLAFLAIYRAFWPMIHG